MIVWKWNIISIDYFSIISICGLLKGYKHINQFCSKTASWFLHFSCVSEQSPIDSFLVYLIQKLPWNSSLFLLTCKPKTPFLARSGLNSMHSSISCQLIFYTLPSHRRRFATSRESRTLFVVGKMYWCWRNNDAVIKNRRFLLQKNALSHWLVQLFFVLLE